MPEKTFDEFIGNERPLEQRLQGISFFPGSLETKAQVIAESSLPFFEKLYFLSKVGLNSDLFKNYMTDIFNRMTIGEIVSEILKPEMISLGLAQYPDIDFRLVFSDQRYDYYQSFIQHLDRTALWRSVSNIAEGVIEEKYLSGLDHFAKVISHMTGQQNFLSGERKLAFISTSEKDYVLKLFEWVKKNYSYERFSDEVNEFMQLAIKGQRKKHTLPERDILAQLAGMGRNHVTIFAFEYSNSKSEMPVLLTARAKTLHSARDKAVSAYSALLSFYGEQSLCYRIFATLPELLDNTLILAKKSNGSTKILEKARDQMILDILQLDGHQGLLRRETQKEAYKVWNNLSDKRRALIWGSLPQDVRSEIVSSLGNYGRLIEKYNTWQEVQNVFDDLFGITLAYPGSFNQPRIEKQVVGSLFNGKAYEIFIPEKGSIKYIQRPGYSATHIALSVAGSYNGIHYDKTTPYVETHLTSLERLLANDTVGEGCHTLYHNKGIRELIVRIPKSKLAVERLESFFNIREISSEPYTKGLLSSIKIRFPEVYAFLTKYGVPISSSP